MKILIVEDEKQLSEGIAAYLKSEDYICEIAVDFNSALEKIEIYDYDCILLDITIPGGNGLDLLKELKASNKMDGVLIISAKNSLDDKITGLSLGADDYLTKPFDLNELHARLRALQRRFVDRATPTIRYGELELDPAGHTITIGGNLINLPRREFALLQKLLESAGQVVTRETLTQTLYGWDEDVDSNTLEVHIHNLRKKLGPRDDESERIKTIRSVGYIYTLV